MSRIVLPLIGMLWLTRARGADLPPPPSPTPAAPAARGEERAWIGAFLGDALDGGVRLVALAPGGPAASAGLRPGDIILQLGERSTPDRAAADRALSGLRPGQKTRIRFVRGGRVEDRFLQTAARAPSWRIAIADSLAAELPDHNESELPEPEVRWIAIPPELRSAWGAPGEAGVLVGAVDSAGFAAKAGLRAGDIVVGIDGSSVVAPRALAWLQNGTRHELEVVRRGASQRLRIVVAPAAGGEVASPADAKHARASQLRVRQLEAEVDRLRSEVRRLQAALERLEGSRE